MSKWQRILAAIALVVMASIGLVRPHTADAATDTSMVANNISMPLSPGLVRQFALGILAHQAEILANGPDDEHFFPETGYLVAGDFWYKWRGVKDPLVNIGYPLSEPTEERLEDGQKYWRQIFERARMELHDGNVVMFGALGARVLDNRPDADALKTAPEPAQCEYRFAQTNKCVGGEFKAYYEQNGGLAQFGLALNNSTFDTLGGIKVWSQYFERVRMELHPELKGTPFYVSLGQLGREYVDARRGGAFGENRLARCLNTESTVQEPGTWFDLPANTVTVWTLWSKDPELKDRRAIFDSTMKIRGKWAGHSWNYPWSCYDTAMEDYGKIDLPKTAFPELMNLGIAGYK